MTVPMPPPAGIAAASSVPMFAGIMKEAETAPRRDARPSLIGMRREEIATALAGLGLEPRQIRMRTSQLWHWMYLRGAASFDQMTNVSKDMRTALAEHFTIGRPEIAAA